MLPQIIRLDDKPYNKGLQIRGITGLCERKIRIIRRERVFRFDYRTMNGTNPYRTTTRTTSDKPGSQSLVLPDLDR